MLRELQVQRSKHRLHQDQDHTDNGIPHPKFLCMGLMGPLFNNELKDKFAKGTQLTGEPQRRSEDRGRNHAIFTAQQVGFERGILCTNRVEHDGERTLHQQQEPRRGLRKAILRYRKLSNHTEFELCPRRTRHRDGGENCKRYLQRHRGKLVIC